MNELLGKEIKKIYVSKDERMLRFDLLEGCLLYYGFGDCHTETWFKDIDISGSRDSCFSFVTGVESINDFGYKIRTVDFYMTVTAMHSNQLSTASHNDILNYGGKIKLASLSEILKYVHEEWTEIKISSLTPSHKG